MSAALELTPPRLSKASMLSDLAQRLLRMSHAARSVPDRRHLLRAAQQMQLMAEQVGSGTQTPEHGQAWIDAGRLFIYEWTVQHAPVS